MHNKKGILATDGVHSFWDVDTNTQLVGDYKIAHPEAEVVGTENYYEQSDNGAGFVASTKVSLSTPASGVNYLGGGVDPLYPGPAGNRDSGTKFTKIPVGAEQAFVQAIDVTIRYMIRTDVSDIAQPYQLRDSGSTIDPGETLVLKGSEMELFTFISDIAAPLASPTTALVSVLYKTDPK